MRLESEHTHYRTRFEMYARESPDDVLPHVLQVLYDWLCNKERKLVANRHPSPCTHRKEAVGGAFCDCELSARGRQFTVTKTCGAPRLLAGVLPICMRGKCDCEPRGSVRDS